MCPIALVSIPILAFIAILLGSPARLTAITAAAINLIIGIMVTYAVTCGCQCSGLSFSHLILSKPAIHLAFGFDGMSAIMVLLSVLVTLAAVMTGTAPDSHKKLWYGSSLLISAGAIGAFMAKDLFFFYAFHELALIPTFLMIGILGRGFRREIAWKITIYLGFGSLVLLAGLVWLANLTGTFDIPTMIQNKHLVTASAQTPIAALLLVGFGTLVSLFPFHSWAAPAYASAPSPIAMLHSGVLKKFGLYGLLRIAIPLCPVGLQSWLTPLLVMLVGNILWVGWITINQKRIDSMLGNSSVMHMGYIFLAIAALIASPTNDLAMPAAILLMFAHGISIALLFSLSDTVERTTGTLDFDDLGGLAKTAPKLAFLFGIAAMASIGLPGLANFSGEVMVFLSAFRQYAPNTGFTPVQAACVLAIWGVVISAVYMLRAYRNTFQGPTTPFTQSVKESGVVSRIPAILLAITLIVVGFCPNVLLNLLK